MKKQETGRKDSGRVSFVLNMRRNWTRLRLRWRNLVREKRAAQFPESERLLTQLLLLGWGLLPMAACHVREWFHNRRLALTHTTRNLRAWFSRHRVRPAAYLSGACALAVLAVVFSFYTVGTTVSYDGREVGSLHSRREAEKVQSSLEKVTARTLGQSFRIDDDLVDYTTHLLPRQEVVDKTTFEEELTEEIGLVQPAYALYVDGERLGATPYEGALEELLERLRKDATTEDTISCSFAEDLEVRKEYVPAEEVMNLGYLAEMLYSTKNAEVTYTVKQGDTWSEIANSHGISSKELLALNPGYDINNLHVGEILTMSASAPYLTMTVEQRESYTEDIPFEVEYTDSDALYKGDDKVVTAGSFGAADVVANVTYVNGEEVERSVLSSVVLKEPVTEHRLRGTKVRPTKAPTGSFRWPTSGHITSRFGPRRSPGGIGSRYHKGIDIGAPHGTPIVAADGGTVTYAGWMRGYGYIVIINHGNGFETRYGHCSSLQTSVGQHVYKGQQIARVGSTGNSTGNHCHFEIRDHGVAKNPLNYL